jgi:hypothetical protein
MWRDNPVKRLAKGILRPVRGTGAGREIRRVAEILRDRGTKKLQMSSESRQFLSKVFREDMVKLQDLLDRDIAHWFHEGRREPRSSLDDALTRVEEKP